jgi:DNA-binding NtrC family response regulator
MGRLKKILVVDDERGIRHLLGEVLSSRGFEVSMAKDGQESLDRLKDNHFDLLITDITMPKLNGIEMLKLMSKAGRQEKVIVMSGNSSDLGMSGVDMSHIVAQLQKPFPVHKFLDVVIAATGDTEAIPETDTSQSAMRR